MESTHAALGTNAHAGQIIEPVDAAELEVGQLDRRRVERVRWRRGRDAELGGGSSERAGRRVGRVGRARRGRVGRRRGLVGPGLPADRGGERDGEAGERARETGGLRDAELHGAG